MYFMFFAEAAKMNSVLFAILSIFLLSQVFLADGKPTIYMKNENDKLEPGIYI